MKLLSIFLFLAIAANAEVFRGIAKGESANLPQTIEITLIYDKSTPLVLLSKVEGDAKYRYSADAFHAKIAVKVNLQPSKDYDFVITQYPRESSGLSLIGYYLETSLSGSTPVTVVVDVWSHERRFSIYSPKLRGIFHGKGEAKPQLPQ